MASNNHKHLRFSFKTDHSTLCFSVTECDNRKYGDGCQKSCGQCVNKTQCDHVIGTCPQGCEAGYKGQMCDQGQLHVIRIYSKRLLTFISIHHFQKEKKTFCKKLFNKDKQKCFISWFLTLRLCGNELMTKVNF